MSHESDEDRHRRKKERQKSIVDGVRGKRKRKKRVKVKDLTISGVPTTVITKLKRQAKEIGCSVSSLVKTYIHNGLEGVVVQGSYTQTVSRSVQQEYKFTAKVNKQPANYAQPAYFQELKRALAARAKRARSARQHAQT